MLRSWVAMAQALPFAALCGNGRGAGVRASPSRLYFYDDSRRGLPLGQVSDRPTKEKHMPLYEHVFLARQDLAQAQVDALAENATKILTDNGGTVVKTETWGLRSLAYRIAKNRKAHYVALDVDAPPQAIAELERQTNINEDVIRFMTIRVDEHEKGPSAMMRRGERDRERGDRGDRGDRGPRGDRGDRPERGDRAPFRAREEEAQ
jgi:small subunit ribosomal protein S6